jgi:hypothetical protein
MTKFKKILPCMLTAAMLFLFSACARKVSFSTSTVVPAAHGTVKIKKDDNDNYLIRIRVLDLARPQRLSVPKKAYVVWMVTNKDRVLNIGQVNTSTGVFSKKYKAYFETVSPFEPTKIFITAENNANIQYPGMQLVLTTGKF